MKFEKKAIVGALVALPLITAGGLAQADSVDAIAVNPTTLDDVGIYGTVPPDPSGTEGKLKYFIPLDEDNKGIYGVTVTPGGGLSGQFSDSGPGTGYGTKTATNYALQTYLYFDVSGFDDSDPSGFLTLEFDDLDLIPENDPANFFEDVEIAFSSDGLNFSGQTGNLQTHAEVQALSSLVPGSFAVDNDGDNLTFQLVVPDSVWSDALLNTEAVFAELVFGVQSTGGSNTPEFLLGAAIGNEAVVPLPAAVWLFGSALVGVAGIGYRRKQTA